LAAIGRACVAAFCQSNCRVVDEGLIVADTLDLFRQSALDTLPIPGADIRFMHHLFSSQEADRIFDELFDSIDWRHDEIVIYGKKMLQPRLTAWYGDPGTYYQYSGLPLTPNPWTDLLLSLKARIEEVTATRYNSVLLNLYRDGKDSVGWHSDNESELGREPIIASLSFGQTRTFQLKAKNLPGASTVKIELTHGSLLVMRGATQRNYVHAVLKSSKVDRPRINLTFRTIAIQSAPE
jgi:alkylated DNA repair dioxygenase AlkB